MQVSQLLTSQTKKSITLQKPSVLPKSTRHQHQCVDPHYACLALALIKHQPQRLRLYTKLLTCQRS